MPRTSQADHLKSWSLLITASLNNQDEMGDRIEAIRIALQEAYDGAKEALDRQALHFALYQQATQDLDGHMTTGIDAAGRVRNGARTAFGLRAAKLAEFGLRPLRPRNGTAKPIPTPPEQVESATQAATPAADSTVQE